MDEKYPDLRMAELLAARFSHELVGPVGAIANGVEIMDEEPDFVRDAGRLIALSAREAGRRLQFYRAAYGATGGLATELVRGLALSFFADGKIACRWPEGLTLPEGWQKLACNLLVMAAETLPRGGSLSLDAATGEPRLTVTASGEDVGLPPQIASLLTAPPDLAALTPRTVQAAFTSALAHRLGAIIVPVTERPRELVLVCRGPKSAA